MSADHGPVAHVQVASVAQLHALVGVELGPTTWYEVTQERVDTFAQATQDFQWIHVDVEKARRSPLGGTIAHGLFTLALGPRFMKELIALDGFSQAINYGYDRVRFMAPLAVGSNLRMRATITTVDDFEGGAQVVTQQTFERDGQEKPVCVAVSVARFYE